jgi:acetolactate synthase-1/2/3 large subunit
VPGSSFRGLHDSVVNYGADRGPQIVLCTSELVAVATAHAYAKATGRVAFAAIHDLVGLMQATMSVYNAWCDRAPVVVLGGGGPADPSRRRPMEWFHTANVQSGLVRDFVKWDAEPITPQATVDAIVHAHRVAATEPTGPVYVTLDAAIQEQPFEDLDLPGPDAFATQVPSAARDEDVEQAARRLLAARLPVIVAGRVGLLRDATPPLTRLAELLAAGLCDERNFTAVPTRHALNLNGDDRLLQEADVVLAVDVHDLNALREKVRGARACALVDLSERHHALRSWTHAGHTPPTATLRLPAQALHGLRQLVGAVERLATAEDDVTRRDRRLELERRASAVRQRHEVTAREEREVQPIQVGRMVEALYEVVRGEPWLLTLRNSHGWRDGVWGFDHGGQFLGGSGGGGIGYGPGALLGGALAARDRGQLPVGIIGDGDLMYAPGVLWSAVHAGVPMLTVVHNNRSYGNDERHQRLIAKARSRPVENAHVGIRLEHPTVDFAALADSHGAVGIGPVTHPDELHGAFTEGLKRARAGAAVLVDVHTG